MTTVDDLLDDITGRQRCTTSDALSTELSARRLGHSQSAFDTNISSQQPGESLLCYFLRLKGLKNYAPVKKFSARPSKEVWIVADADNVQHVAKVLNMELMSPNERRFAMNEVKCLAQCHHPNIIRYVHDFEYEGMILLIMELALAGDLSLQVHARSRNRAFFRRHEALVVFCQLCLSIDYIHNQNMMHRDIKSENIFITSAGVLKLGDFGFTRQYDVTLSGTPGGTFCGTPHYLSPEICTHRPYGRKSDLFSAGVVLYELLALERPFKGATIAEIMGNVVAGRYIPVNKMNPDCGEDMAHLCHGLLALDPEQRLSLQDIFSASFIRVALSELRVAVLGMTKIPDSDRCAIQSHIERILGSTTCAGVRWLAMEGHTLLDDPSGNLYELVITASEPKAQSDRAHYLSLRPWRPLIPHYEREGNGRTPVDTPILGSIVEIDMRNIQSIEIYRDEDYVNGDVIQIKMTTPPSHITHEMLKGFTNREWFLRAQSPREAMQCLKSLEFM